MLKKIFDTYHLNERNGEQTKNETIFDPKKLSKNECVKTSKSQKVFHFCYILLISKQVLEILFVTIMCRNDELSLTMS